MSDRHRQRPLACLVSPYAARSHHAWARGVIAHCDTFDWHLAELPPRHFAWRAQGSAVSLLDPALTPPVGRKPVLALTTSVLDLAAARGLVPWLNEIPVAVYFHENQFAYPPGAQSATERRVLQFISVKTALAADRVVFNSHFNQRSFLAGADALLRQLPDAVPAMLVSRLENASEVLPVPLADDVANVARTADPDAPLRVVWNHRWEYDKGPDRLLLALRALRAAGTRIELVLCGQQFRDTPPPLQEIQTDFGDMLVSAGDLNPRAVYLEQLAQADVVLSTALHDFQGLAVLEGIAAGCIPLVPDRLAYREFVDAAFRYAEAPDAPDEEAATLARRLTALAHAKRARRLPQPPTVHALRWAELGARYRALLHALADSVAVQP